MRRLLLSFGAASLILGGFLLVLGPSRLATQLSDAHLEIFALGLVSVLFAFVCWGEASRRLFVTCDTPLSGRRALVAYGAGAFGKQVLPMGNAGGPAVMAYAFDREVDLGYSRSLGVIVVAEFLSLVASIVLGFAGIAILLLAGQSGAELRWLGLGVVLVGAALAALSAVVWYRRRHVGLAVTGIVGLLAPIVGRLSPTIADRLEPERVDAELRRYFETFDAVVGNRTAVLSAFGLSLLGWAFFALPLYTAAMALEVALSPALVLFLVPAAGLATVFPLPGGLGGLEVALAGLLAVLAAIDITTAGAVVILFRLCSFWFFVLVCGIAASIAAGTVRNLPAATGKPSATHGDSTLGEGPDDG